MIVMSPENKPMKLYRAIYKEANQQERTLDMYAHSLSSATLSADELIGPKAELIRVYENPDW